MRPRSRASRPPVRRTRPAPRPPSDGDPALQRIWSDLRRTYFPDRPDLDRYLVVWSTRRQKRTLASCSPVRKKVRVARELNRPEHMALLEPLLYHEMCHAFLAQKPCRHHGREFKALERRHPGLPALNAWIRRGDWRAAVRSDRARRAHAARRRGL